MNIVNQFQTHGRGLLLPIKRKKRKVLPAVTADGASFAHTRAKSFAFAKTTIIRVLSYVFFVSFSALNKRVESFLWIPVTFCGGSNQKLLIGAEMNFRLNDQSVSAEICNQLNGSI